MQIFERDDTIVAIATPPGTGAIAVLRLSGKDAIAIAESVFSRKKLKTAKAPSVHVGFIEDAEKKIDEVVISIFREPASYTGEDVVEISCHGSPYIQQQILNLLLKKGARMAKPGEFTLRAFLNGKMDLSQAEAVADLIASDSAASHELAIKQMRGGFSADISELRNQLIRFASLIELELDFSEEDVEFVNRKELMDLILLIREKIKALIHSFELGNVIKNGVPAVIAGRPNAGKSTLLNALLNEERALVSEVAGTTRDTVEEEINIRGIIFRLIDTAGIREATDAVERAGVMKTMEKIRQSVVLIYVFDVGEMSEAEVLSDIKKLHHEGLKIFPAGNKIDLDKENNYWNKFLKVPDTLFISSSEHIHLDILKNNLYDAITEDGFNPANPIVSNARHLEALQHTDAALMEVLSGMQNHISGELLALDIRRALEYLGQITGEIYNDDILDSIFRNFCIGK